MDYHKIALSKYTQMLEERSGCLSAPKQLLIDAAVADCEKYSLSLTPATEKYFGAIAFWAMVATNWKHKYG